MKINKKIIEIMAVSLTLAVGTPVWAQEFKAENGVVTIETADDSWEEQSDSKTLMTLTDGDNMITLQHFSNGEKLPEITVADDTYPMVCQNVISTKNEVFLVTGRAGVKEDFESVKKAVQGIVINKYDTKKAVKKSESSSDGSNSSDKEQGKENTSSIDSSSSIKEVGFTGWVTTDSVCVRSNYSLSSEIIGYVFLQDPVEITGIVNNSDSGKWYRINYDGSVGYVSADYISETPSTTDTMGIELTDEMVTIYQVGGESAVYIYKSTDGKWYDGSGRQYSQDESGTWEQLSNGSIWTEESPETPDTYAEEEVAVDDGEGNSQILYLQEDGGWMNIAGGIYTDNGDGTYTGPDGTVWYN